MSLLAVQGLSLQQGARRLVEGLGLTVQAGECWALIGRNGAGKTTLLHTLAGVRPIASGRVALEGRALHAWPPRARARRLGLLPQDAGEGFEESVLEAVLAGRHPYIGRWANEGEEDVRLARAALRDSGLAGLESRAVRSLSGGERRRLALATVLTQNPSLLLLDEPLNHLDLSWQWRIMQHLRGLTEEGRSMVMSLHEPNLALRFCTHALLLDGQGGWQAGAVAEAITPKALEQTLGMAMRRLEDPEGGWLVPDTRRLRAGMEDGRGPQLENG